MNIAIIPARGGSKRIPEKNIRPFLGKPIIAYSISAALESNLFERVMVSTDSEKIADVAVQYGADVPFMRPAKLSDCFTPIGAAVHHALNVIQEKGRSYTYACCILATAPFIRVDDLKKGLTIMKEKKAASTFTVTTFPFPVFRALKITDDGRLEMIWPEHKLTRSNDLPEAYHDAGQFYWLDVNSFLRTGEIYSADAVPVIVPRFMVQDIDTEEDWSAAEKLYIAQQLDRDSGSYK